MTNPTIRLLTDTADTTMRIANAVRAARIDRLVPDHKEAALAAERYLLGASARGHAIEEWLRERRVANVVPRHRVLRALLER